MLLEFTQKYIFKNEPRTKLLLFLCSFAIYFIYFHHIFLNLNSIVSSITLDTLKNYYTYVYHIKYDDSALHFSGMSYPYGEHVVYTDCQPLLTFILRALPFTHNYLIGILHFFIFFSFITTPLILYAVFRRMDLGRYSAFFVSLGIALLSPQYLKINAGHHGLAYGCLIPFSILLTQRYLSSFGTKQGLLLFLYHCLLFLLHPYMGFSIAIFSFMSALIFKAWAGKRNGFLKQALFSALWCLSPIVLFKLFMLVTDQHPGRTTEPYGVDLMVENMDSLLAPVFGPMKPIMETWFNKRPDHFEGHTYLGLTSLLMLPALFVLAVLYFKKITWRAEGVAFLLSSFVLLMFALGWHNKLFGILGMKVEFMNQFRATCRFAWFFYFGLAVFLVPALRDILNLLKEKIKPGLVITALPLVFFGLNLWEAHYMFSMDRNVFWRFRNIFSEKLLLDEEKKLIGEMQGAAQALMPLPVFHSGSEMYDRTGMHRSMLASMFHSAHTGIPIFSVLMSRTSIPETENELNLLNSYKRQRPAAQLLNEKPIIILKTNDGLMPDEERLLDAVRFFHNNDTLSVGFVSKTDFLKRKVSDVFEDLSAGQSIESGADNIIYVPRAGNKPFTEASQKDASMIYVLDSNKLAPGSYCLSFRYYYTEKTFRSVACNIIITEGDQQSYQWKHDVPIRIFSGFYDGFSVFEYPVEVLKGKRYEFFIQGRVDKPYHISDFMLRPTEINTRIIGPSKKDTAFNNFPD